MTPLYEAYLPIKDLEDAMQSAAAHACPAKYIITRNLPDYKHSPVPALSPNQFIDLLNFRAP